MMNTSTTKSVRYSVNRKLNAVMNEIREDILTMKDSAEESLGEMLRYMREFPYEADYNLYQYGNLLIYYKDIRNLFKRCGYKEENYSDSMLHDQYKRLVGSVDRSIRNSIQ